MESRFIRIVCAVLFCLFSFCYLYFFQADVMTIVQHLASGGQTFYNPLLGAVLITITLKLLQVGISSWTKLSKRGYALTYFPSFLLLTDQPLQGLLWAVGCGLLHYCLSFMRLS